MNFCIISSFSRSTGLKVMRAIKIEEQFKPCVQLGVLMQVSTVSEFFSWIYCQKLSKNRFPQPLSALPKTFYPLHKQYK